MNKNKKFNLQLLIGTSLVTLIICLIWLAYNWSVYTGLNRLTKIEIQNTHIISQDEYYAYLMPLLEQPINEIDIREIGLFMESHPLVRVARVSRSFPQKLKVEISEREPVAMLNMDPILYVDAEGVVLPDIGNINKKIFPVLSGFNRDQELYPIGQQTVSIKILEAVLLIDQIVNEYPNLYNNLSEVTLNNSDEFVLILADHPTKVILGVEHLWEKIHILKSFVNALPEANGLGDFSTLDLRYNRQVIAKVKV